MTKHSISRIQAENSNSDSDSSISQNSQSQDQPERIHTRKLIKKSNPKNEKTHSHQKLSSYPLESNKNTSTIAQMVQENSDQIYREDSDLHIQDIQLSQKSQIQNQNSHSNLDKGQSSQKSDQSPKDSQDFHEDDIEDLRMIFVQFFNSIEQPNGLVFKPQVRKKLNKKYKDRQFTKGIKGFTKQHDLDPDIQEVQKILPEVLKIILFNKNNHQLSVQQKEQRNFEKYIKLDLQIIKNIFREASYIFCQQVTHQLYRILREMCNIVLKYKESYNEAILDNNSNTRIKLREFGNKIASHSDPEHLYEFFGYQFFKFPNDMTEEQQQKEHGKEKYKYALMRRFRKPNTEFAKFAQKAGIHLWKKIVELQCYKTFRGN